MRGYDDDRDDYGDYYEDYEGQGYGEEEYEEEEAEEEPQKPTKEELQYLELRQKLKESIRKKMKKESSGSGSSISRMDSTDYRKRNKLPYDNYGSFFGPSQPVIAHRVIEESKSFLENPRLAPKVPNPHHIKKNPNKVSDGGSKSISHNPAPKVSESRVKSQKLKDTRDYSFLLSDEAEVPAPSKGPSTQNVPLRNSEGRPAHQAPGRSKHPSSNGGKLVPGLREERKPGSVASHLPPRPGSNYKSGSTSKPSMTSADPRKQLGNNSGNGPGRPVGPKVPPKLSTGTTGNKSAGPGIRNPVNSVQKPLPSKSHSSVPRQIVEPRRQIVEPRRQTVEPRRQTVEPRRQTVEQRRQSVEQRKDIGEPNKPKVISKQPVASSKPQMNKSVKQNSVHTSSQDHRPKKKVVRRHPDDVEDDMDISRMIRSMFNYNPNKFVDDDDDDNMEAGFDEILKEEKRSAQIARREDEEQLRLIEEEEERERRRRMSKLKKRKHGE